ncbi:hypothetical protein HS1genome_0239 [Sulfodiicoccus acidiphilus]|uniref:Uncharacterized protein n=2 Tax=Sulfodiicoccus acidiphilus TaxID=1670455 RepID=A0A348B0Z8_9CREN|nr:hypothetical protein HS1genome_0239 [Sulfodiicoccus acidiphilus]GGU02447.1 hypothetical protein GCM10007116_19400 [Sulfodiicoccus acidiphilus]
MHIEERKERTVFRWAQRELGEFLKKFSKDERLITYIDEIDAGLRTENYEKVLEGVSRSLATIDEMLQHEYTDMANS